METIQYHSLIITPSIKFAISQKKKRKEQNNNSIFYFGFFYRKLFEAVVCQFPVWNFKKIGSKMGTFFYV